jgi:hypothetical protein
MQAQTVEDLLQNQIAACLAATEDCLAQSRRRRADDTYGHQRRNDVAYLAKLMKASARLIEAMAQLRGNTRHSIHVTRGDTAPGSVPLGVEDKG